MKNYSIEIPGLAEAIAATAVHPKHADLLATIRRHEDLAAARLVTNRGDSYLGRRKVLAPDGTLIANDHEVWIAAELEKDGGQFARTQNRLKGLGYFLTQCEINTLYIVEDRGGP